MYRILFPLVALSFAACNDTEHPDEVNENEVITTVRLTFTPENGDPIEFNWADPENDGDPQIDNIVLQNGVNYDLAVSFLNELEDPPENITEEVLEESDQHQIFFTGTTVEGPATGDKPDAVVEHAYADTDTNGLPIGLENTISSLALGSGSFIVTLRHLPMESDTAIKVDGLAELAAEEGLAAVPGDVDASAEFGLSVE